MILFFRISVHLSVEPLIVYVVARDEFVSEYSVPRIITQYQGLSASAIFASIFVLNCLSLALMMASAF